VFEWLGGLEDLVGDLYPYRWQIVVALVTSGAALAAVAVRLRWHRAVWRHRLVSLAIIVPVLAVALPVGWYVASPLWERSRLDESSPLADVTAQRAGPFSPEEYADAMGLAGELQERARTDEAPLTVPAAFPRLTRRGTFAGADDFHFGRGAALLIETTPGDFILRFEDFSVRNGPDLFVYLTNDRNDVSAAVNLGELRATDGNFNYDVPGSLNPHAFRYVIVWCRQFATRFALATLE
jgi:hypothetical protein